MKLWNRIVLPSDEAKRAAETEVKQVSGVKSVDNELRVVAESRQQRVEAKDDDIKDRVAKRLDDNDITVAVSDGVVRLTGSVDNQTERLQALTTARATPGVRSVVDGLELNDRHAASAH